MSFLDKKVYSTCINGVFRVILYYVCSNVFFGALYGAERNIQKGRIIYEICYMAKLKKDELLDELSKNLGVSKKQSNDMLVAFTEVLTKNLKKGNEIPLPGLGIFKVGNRKERTTRNPQTGAPMKVPAKRVPKFTAGKALKDAVM